MLGFDVDSSFLLICITFVIAVSMKEERIMEMHTRSMRVVELVAPVWFFVVFGNSATVVHNLKKHIIYYVVLYSIIFKYRHAEP